MFGKVSDKTRRDAYLTALSEERDNFVDKKDYEGAPKERNNKGPENREIVSGKEAIKLANKDINITGTYDKNAIKDDNKIVNMNYYKNWRERLANIEKEEQQQKPEQSVAFGQRTASVSNLEGPADRVKPSYSGDEFGREPGLYGDDTTLNPEKKKYSSSKDLLDSLFSSNTKDEEDDNSSLLDKLFKNKETSTVSASASRPSFLNKRFATSYRENASDAQENKNQDLGYADSIASSDYNLEPDEKYTLDNFEDDLDEDDSYSDITKASTLVNSSNEDYDEEDEIDDDLIDDEMLDIEPPKPQPKVAIDKQKQENKPRKKKKKYDADIIGATGFFTA